MRLEAAAIGGRVHEVPLQFGDEAGIPVLDTVELFVQLDRLVGKASVCDVAATAQDALARGMASLAMKVAGERGISSIALSGGVAYNDHIASRIREMTQSAGYAFVTNQLVPCGDGGVSLGQAVAAGLGYRLAHASSDVSG